jgi:hypothetical protein
MLIKNILGSNWMIKLLYTTHIHGSGYAFNIEPEFEELYYLTLIKQANVRIEAHSNNPIPEPCMCVVYSNFIIQRDISLKS